MIHRAMLGSLERFLGILIEHTAGAFPFWLAPEQVRLLSITERAAGYAADRARDLVRAGLRAEADLRNETIGAKIREARLGRVPAILVVGDREVADGTVAVRLRAHGDVGAVPFDTFAREAAAWVATRVSEPAPPATSARE